MFELCSVFLFKILIMLLFLVVFLDMFYRSFPRIEQFNAAYKRQKKTGLDHISQRYFYMYYTDAHIRAGMNTKINLNLWFR